MDTRAQADAVHARRQRATIVRLALMALGSAPHELAVAQDATVEPELQVASPELVVPAPASAPPLGSRAPLVQRNQPGQPLRGFVDLHTHAMSYLGFGGKAVHGAPDVGSLVPAGTRECNASAFRARSIDEALGHCNGTHGGWGLDNTCGDYLRAGIINHALVNRFKYKVGVDRNLHGDHEHAGYPDFRYWPHQTSVLHQQMWWEWVERAYRGACGSWSP